MEEYLQAVKTAYAQGIELIHEIQGWTRIKTDSEAINCFRRPNPESKFDMFKGDMFYDKPPSVVSRYIFDNFTEINNELMSDVFEYWKDVERYSKDAKVVANLLKGKGPFLPRDGVVVVVYLDLGNDTYA